jgi:hypothetical protein
VDAMVLIRRLAQAQFRNRGEELSEDEIWYIWQQAGGNPRAIQSALQTLYHEQIGYHENAVSLVPLCV